VKDIKHYLKTNTVIHCKTQEEHDKIFQLLKSNKYTYYDKSISNNWTIYKEKFCFNLYDSTLHYSSLKFFQENNYTIYPASDFLEEDLLAIAKEKYPIGTIIKPLEVNYGGDFGYEVRFTKYSNYGKQLYIDGNLLIYNNGEWAEIVEKKQELEYVKLTNKKIWSVDNEFTGEIFKLSDLSNLSKFKNAPDKESFRRLIKDWIKQNAFEVSNKEAYDLQENKLEEIWIPKIGDWCVTTTHYNNEIWYKGRIWQIGKIERDGFCVPIQNGRLLDQSLKMGFRKALSHEIPIEQQSIKQYPLTKEECFIDLKNTKIWIGDNPELNRKVQEKLFSLGFSWYKDDKTIRYTNSKSLWLYHDKTLGYENIADNFIKDSRKEIFPSDLGINETTNYYKVDIFLSNTNPIDFLPKKEEFPTANKIIYSEKKQIKLTELEIPKPIKIFKR
jgi:hypothetical protein